MDPKDDSPPRTPAQQAVHDTIADEIEQTLPEGPSPKGPAVKHYNRLLFAFGAVAIGSLVAFLFIKGGWAAGSVGLFVLFLYAFLGSTPWMAGTLRAKEHKEVEAAVTMVEHEISERTPQQPARS